MVGLVLPIHREKRKHPLWRPEVAKDPLWHDAVACSVTLSFSRELHGSFFSFWIVGVFLFPVGIPKRFALKPNPEN